LQIKVEMDEQRSFYHGKSPQIWLWRAVDHESGEVIAFWFGTREHHRLDTLKELLSPLKIGTVGTDGNDAYVERCASEVRVVPKRNTQKIERKHVSLRTWCSRLVRKGLRFAKTAQMYKIALGLVINVWWCAYTWIIQYSTLPQSLHAAPSPPATMSYLMD
jgi:insertion element IS1 protein InsB